MRITIVAVLTQAFLRTERSLIVSVDHLLLTKTKFNPRDLEKSNQMQQRVHYQNQMRKYRNIRS